MNGSNFKPETQFQQFVVDSLNNIKKVNSEQNKLMTKIEIDVKSNQGKIQENAIKIANIIGKVSMVAVFCGLIGGIATLIIKSLIL